MERGSGILLPIFSLKSKYGIGTFGSEAYNFVDFLEKSHQKYWQLLPLNPTSYGDSPYQSFSAFALNPYFIDLDYLVKDKYLTKEEVRKLVDHAVGFLVDKGCQAIVLACNTATSAAISYLREKYKLPIIGIEPAVKPAVENIHESGKRVMVVSTPVTAKGEKLKKLVDKYDNKHIVDVVALPKLVRFAQDDDFDSSDVTDYLKSEFAPYNLNDYSELVLGCTHFNYFKDSFSKLFPDDLEMVDGNTGVSNNLKNTVVKKVIFKE